MPQSVRYLLVLLVLAALIVGGWFVFLKTHPLETIDPATGKPIDPAATKAGGRLVVLVVFDQMRGDYLARWEKQFTAGGFERMKKEGIWFANAELPYACASTGPGHASIATGAPPAATGIVENEWYDRSGDRDIYCAEPLRPYELVPPIPASDKKASRGSGIGFSPDRLLAETVADKLKAASGGRAKVVSLSIKDRTAAMMGGRKPDALYCYDTRDGRFHTDTYYRDQPQAWVEDFNAAGAANRWVGKTWDLFRPILDYKQLTGQPNPAPGSGYGVSQHHNFPHAMADGKAAGPEYYEAVETSPYGNELLYELVKKAIASEKLGTGDTADLLCVSFSSNDLIGHYWGPDSWEVLDITLRSDQMMADFLAFLDGTVGKEKYTLVMTADHGVCPIPEQNAATKTARRVMMEAGNNEIYTPLTAALNERFGIPSAGPTQWFAGEAKEQARVWPWVYLNYRALEGRGLRPEPVAEFVRDWFIGQAFIEAAYTREEIEEIDLAKVDPWSIAAKVKRAFYAPRCGDVVAVPKPGVLVTTYKSGTNHGMPHLYDTHVPVLAYGRGISQLGKRSERVSSLIVAPMVSRALGIDPPADAIEKAAGMFVSP